LSTPPSARYSTTAFVSAVHTVSKDIALSKLSVKTGPLLAHAEHATIVERIKKILRTLFITIVDISI
jgi:hypothetical protein